MLLATYRSGTAARTGLLDDAGHVYDLSAALEASGADGAAPGLLELVEQWERWHGSVTQAADLLAESGTPEPVGDATVMVPFPDPRRDAFALAGNYRKHVESSEQRTGLPLTKRDYPVFFVKPTGTFLATGAAIEYDPALTTQVDYEVEFGVVIGRRGRDIPASRAMEHVFGYVVINDISARDLQIRKPQVDYFRGKGLDTFMPIGPGIKPREWLADHRGLALRLRVNGELRQSGTTDQMIRDVPDIVAELSRSLTLLPGDVIATGTPEGVALEMEEPRYLQHGDLVETEIESLGTLVNPVRHRPTDRP